MPTIPELLEQAALHHRAGRLHLAEEPYRLVLQTDPNHVLALHMMGLLAYQRSQPDVAVDFICRAIAISPNDAALHSTIALPYLAQKQYEEAAASCRRALELQPNSAAAYHNLGLVLAGQCQLHEAIACYRRALELHPGNAQLHHSLGNAYYGQGKLVDAAASFSRTIERQPDFANAHNSLGIVLLEQGELEPAIACHQRAVNLQPDRPPLPIIALAWRCSAGDLIVRGRATGGHGNQPKPGRSPCWPRHRLGEKARYPRIGIASNSLWTSGRTTPMHA